MDRVTSNILRALLEKGVRIPLPQGVYVAPEVDPDRISGKGVVIHPGCRISGANTLIMDNCELGTQGPATVVNCQLGRNVRLASGYFEESCFLDGASMGPGAHVREYCLLEEWARGAHTVGIKHTILFPFVTLGSLINFCDCLMAGGTDEKNHSEVGSSYIHFNYTPNQDKATASLIGDVPRGVMLNQPPIFLGGQGGLVGPVRITYGVVVAAGTIVRKDLLEENTVLLGHPSITRKVSHRFGVFSNIKRIIELNSMYIGNLIALRAWYSDVRRQFASATSMGEALLKAGIDKIERAVSERIRRLGQVAERMEESIEVYSASASGKAAQRLIARKREFQKNWPVIKSVFEECLDSPERNSHYETFLNGIEQAAKAMGGDYVSCIRALTREQSEEGTMWLQGIVDNVMNRVWEALPSFGVK